MTGPICTNGAFTEPISTNGAFAEPISTNRAGFAVLLSLGEVCGFTKPIYSTNGAG